MPLSTHRRRLHRASVLVLLLAVLVTTVGSFMTRTVVHRNEERLLEQKAAEGSLVLSSLMGQSYGAGARALASALTATAVNQAAFSQIAGALQAPSTGEHPGLGLGGVALLDLAHARVMASSGDVLADLTSPTVLAAVKRAISSKSIVGTPPDLGFVQLAERGDKRAMSMALQLMPGVVGYAEMPLTGVVQQQGDLGPGQPFAGLDFAVYVGSPSVSHLLWTNQPGGRLGSRTAVAHADLNVNATFAGQTGAAAQGPLTIVLSARHPLVGGFATAFPWLMLPFGLIAGLVMMALTEATQRRRDDAVSMVSALQARNAEVERAVAEKAEAEERLRQAQRLEAVGQLAGGIAHDFNNLLAVIISYAGFLKTSVPAHAVEDVDEIDKAAHRAAELTQQLLMFSRRDPARPSVVDARALVADREKLLRRTLSEDIELIIDLPDHPVHVRADAVELDQVVMNLVVNARDAIPHGGQLQLVMTEVPAKDGGTDVQLLVADNGTGMPPEVLEHAFEPFFTTKEVGRGTGLGLATVYGIVTRWDGDVRITSTPGQGTCVTVQLPRCPAPAEQAPAKAVPARTCGPATVLLVEDEDGVRRATQRILEQAGFEVVVAHNGKQALELFAAHEIDVLVTDVVMPGGMSGPDLAEHCRLRRPDLPVVLSSGHSRDHLSRRGPLPPGTQLIRKPFTSDALVDAVRTALDDRKALA